MNIRLDSAVIPNPFFGVSSATFPDSDQRVLTLVDGGEDGETTPFQPLLVKARGVDTIIAIDAVRSSSSSVRHGLYLTGRNLPSLRILPKIGQLGFLSW